MSFLNDLKKEREGFMKINLKTYEKVLELCLENIKFFNKNGKTSMIYEIPVFVPGHPLVDQKQCALYLFEKLKHMKLKPKIVKGVHLFIDWS